VKARAAESCTVVGSQQYHTFKAPYSEFALVYGIDIHIYIDTVLILKIS
jgi:hypothetical protein